MTSTVCVDSSVALNLYLPQPLSAQAEALWRSWQRQNDHLVAPSLFRYEVTTVLRRNVHFGVITPEEGLSALNEILASGVEYPSIANLHVRAYQTATRFGLSRANDTHYLVLAEALGCEFWTADAKLVNAVKEALPWVNFLGDYSPS